jgi:acyl carrier protein
VIHTAGIAGGGLMQFRTKEQAAAVLGAKVTGTMLLAELLAEAEEQLDFMMLCSSMTAVLGGVGQADYCGANAFLDAFAQSESGQGRRTVAINWDAWREVGMAAQGGLALGGGQTTNMFELQLRVGLESEQGVEAFHRIMGGTRLPQVLVSRRELQSAIKAADKWRDSRLLEDIEQHFDSTVQSHGRPELQTPYVPPRDETQMTLCAIFQDLLGIDQIGIYDNFFELGGDSLVAIQLTNRLRKAFGLELRTINLFKAATVAELSEEIRKDSAVDSLDQSSAIARAPREIQRIQRSASNELVFQATD